MNIEDSLDIIKGKLLMIKKLLKNDEENGHSSSYEMQKEDFEAIETLLTSYEKEKKDNEQWEKYATNDLENQITERNNKIFELEEELKKEKEKNKEYKDMIIRHKNQLKQSGIYGYDFDLEILEEE